MDNCALQSITDLIRSKIKAKDTKKIYSYLSDKDPSEVKLALNEIINI